MKKTFFILIVFLQVQVSCAQGINCEELIIDYADFIETDSTKWSLNLYNENTIKLVYFGAFHSKNPTDIQFEKIDSLWKLTAFDIALFEGPDRGVLNTREETIEQLGESGLVRYLAIQDSVLTKSLEPSPVEEINFLSGHFSIDKIKLFFLLREAQRVREAFDWGEDQITEHIIKILSKANNIPLLSDDVLTVQEIEHSFIKYWGNELKWWEAPRHWFDPGQKSEETGGIFTNDINRYSSYFRDVHMYRLITGYLKENKRIFAVVGRNHIPMQEDAIKCEWEKFKHKNE